MNTLDPLSLPIAGRCLIQSSAGTGKTYTIVSLVLRLLLGQNERGEAARSYRIDEILIVTFTNAATEELRHRLHQRLQSARAAFATGSTPDPFLQRLLEQSKDQGKDLKLLHSAIDAIDQAAIFTIHAFCRLMLTSAVFESGMSPQQKFILDDSALKQAAVQDFWRREVHALAPALNRVVRHRYADPDALFKAVNAQAAHRHLVVKEYQNKPLSAVGDELIASLQAVQTRWQQDAVRVKIEASRISTRQESGGSKNRLNLMDRWAKNSTSALLMVAEDGAEYLSVEQLARYYRATKLLAKENLKQTGDDIDIAEFLAAVERFIAQLTCLHAALYVGAIQDIQVATHLDNNQEIGMDGLIHLALEKLQGSSDSPLATQMRTRYPMAFIDEFQDTDPIQWEIFDLLYPHRLRPAFLSKVKDATQQSNHALIMIGDPKQSIFAFRGADINAYLRARKSVAADKRLDSRVNWRSSVGMIAAINALYQAHRDPFAHKGIPFSPVQPQPQAKQVGLRRGAAMPALTFWYHADQTGQAHIAATTASTIVSLLDGKTEINDKPLEPEGITCLVRDRHEADALHKALLKRGLGSVRRNRNSVFHTKIALDFASILAAVLTSADRRSIRTALVCPLLNMRLANLYQEINEDETAWEKHVERFKHYRRLWQNEGIMVMLHGLLLDYGLDAAWLQRHKEHARSITDLRQIAELLQQQSLHLGSMRQLYRWFNNAIKSQMVPPDEFQVRLESDANLVQIATVQSAKGLQYEVVILPFGMRGTSIDKEPALTHTEQEEGAQPILSMNPDAATRQQHLKEQLGENLRLLYVALTRAKYACFVGVSVQDGANITSKKGVMKGDKAVSTILTNPIRHLLLQPTAGQALKDDAITRQLEKLTDAHEQIGWCFAGTPLDVMEQGEHATTEASAARETAAGRRHAAVGADEYSIATRSTFAGHIDPGWGVTSYSRLIATKAFHAELTPGWQDENHPAEDGDEAVEAAKDAEAADAVRSDLGVAARFPKGAAAGLCLHDMLEHWPTQQRDEQQHVHRTLLTHNLWQDEDSAEVLNWLRVVRQTPLDTGINLANLPQQCKEMSFYFPMQQASSSELCRILHKYGYGSGALAQKSLQGMMHGYIDLAFEHQDKLWVLDYKSNWLGDQKADYSEQAMTSAIKTHRYDLQFLIYSLALYRLLRWRYPEAEAASKVGVYYLFLRGMDGSGTTGLYRHVPVPAVLMALDRFFAGGTT